MTGYNTGIYYNSKAAYNSAASSVKVIDPVVGVYPWLQRHKHGKKKVYEKDWAALEEREREALKQFIRAKLSPEDVEMKPVRVRRSISTAFEDKLLTEITDDDDIELEMLLLAA